MPYDARTSRAVRVPLTGTNRLSTSVKLRLARFVRNIIIVINDALTPTSADEYRRAAEAHERNPSPAFASVDATSAYALRCSGARRCAASRGTRSTRSIGA